MTECTLQSYVPQTWAETTGVPPTFADSDTHNSSDAGLRALFRNPATNIIAELNNIKETGRIFGVAHISEAPVSDAVLAVRQVSKEREQCQIKAQKTKQERDLLKHDKEKESKENSLADFFMGGKDWVTHLIGAIDESLKKVDISALHGVACKDVEVTEITPVFLPSCKVSIGCAL